MKIKDFIQNTFDIIIELFIGFFKAFMFGFFATGAFVLAAKMMKMALHTVNQLI